MIFPWFFSFLQISRAFHEIQWFFHDLETDLNFNDFSRAVGTLKGYEINGINNNNFIYLYMYLVIIIMINFGEDFNSSFLELRLALKPPELELELKSLELELELELKLIVSSGIGIGIGIENNGIGIGIELRKWNWPQPWVSSSLVAGTVDYAAGLAWASETAIPCSIRPAAVKSPHGHKINQHSLVDSCWHWREKRTADTCQNRWISSCRRCIPCWSTKGCWVL